jgi:hypothetical protein
LDAGVDITEVVKEVLELFQFMRPDHEYVIHITEPTSGLIDHPLKCHFLKSEPLATPSICRTGY